MPREPKQRLQCAHSRNSRLNFSWKNEKNSLSVLHVIHVLSSLELAVVALKAHVTLAKTGLHPKPNIDTQQTFSIFCILLDMNDVPNCA